MVVKALLEKLTQDVRRIRRDANAARDAGDWDNAARLYGEVVRIKPDAAAIWVQLGHARKEAGRFELAEEAYLRARQLQPYDMETALQLGHLYKLRGNTAAAVTHYQSALDGGVDDPHARHFLTTAAAQTVASRLPPSVTPASRPAVDTGPALYFDYSDLLVYFRDNRLPTGIQRVQIKLWQALMVRSGGVVIRGCVYSSEAGGWVALDPVGFTALCNLTAKSGDTNDADWRGALDHLRQRMASRRPVHFPPGSALVNFGTSWWMPGYMAEVRAAKARFGVRYVPLIYDLIPVITPDLVGADTTQSFAAWASSVFMHADLIGAISACTGRDVERFAQDVKPLAQPPVIMPLDADFEEGAPPPSSGEVAARLDGFGLSHGQFVLFVSTLEARKNQMLAFKGWSRLIDEVGRDAVPTLVCVGKQGFGFETLQAYLVARPDLSDKVMMMSGISDTDLRALYAGCLFTVYPSTYEGWGLPVTESLCHGKVCLAGNHSSLPEAGGRFAAYCDVDSVASFVEQARRLIFQPTERQRLEALIASEFRPRPWTQVLTGFVDEVTARLARLPPPTPPVAPVQLGQRYRFGNERTRRLDRTAAIAEMLRTGAGWHAGETWGVWTREPVARLSLAFDSQASAGKDVIAYITVRAPHTPATVTVRVGPARLATCEVPAHGTHLLIATIPAEIAWAPATANRPLVLQIGTDAAKPLTTLGEADTRQAGIGLVDITFCAVDDIASRLTVIERSVMTVAEAGRP